MDLGRVEELAEMGSNRARLYKEKGNQIIKYNEELQKGHYQEAMWRSIRENLGGGRKKEAGRKALQQAKSPDEALEITLVAGLDFDFLDEAGYDSQQLLKKEGLNF